MYSTIKLISETITKDELRMEVITETENEIFAEVESISQSEFYAAKQADLKPEYRFKVFFGDYNGEKLLKYEGDRYGIYRTFRNGDRMELYAEFKAGRESSAEPVTPTEQTQPTEPTEPGDNDVE